jgi:uridylate kinase
MGEDKFGIDISVLRDIANQVKQVIDMGVQMAIVIGGGNLWRGATWEAMGMERTNADYAGMLATLLNALALQDALEKAGAVTRVQSALTIIAVAEPYVRRRAIRHLEKGRVVIFACGTGNPYMTTDTAAALRAIEINAEALLMGKHRVDGVYSADPSTVTTAKKFDQISYSDALKLRLRIMDATALSLCMEHNLPILVFDIGAPRGILQAITGEVVGTKVTS